MPLPEYTATYGMSLRKRTSLRVTRGGPIPSSPAPAPAPLVPRAAASWRCRQAGHDPQAHGGLRSNSAQWPRHAPAMSSRISHSTVCRHAGGSAGDAMEGATSDVPGCDEVRIAGSNIRGRTARPAWSMGHASIEHACAASWPRPRWTRSMDAATVTRPHMSAAQKSSDQISPSSMSALFLCGKASSLFSAVWHTLFVNMSSTWSCHRPVVAKFDSGSEDRRNTGHCFLFRKPRPVATTLRLVANRGEPPLQRHCAAVHVRCGPNVCVVFLHQHVGGRTEVVARAPRSHAQHSRCCWFWL